MSQQQRDALDQMLRDAPLDLGGDVAEQRVIFEEMMAAIPVPADVTTSSGSLGGIPVVNVEVAGADQGGSSSTSTAAHTRSERPHRPSGSHQTSRVAPEPVWSQSTTGWRPNTHTPPRSRTLSPPIGDCSTAACRFRDRGRWRVRRAGLAAATLVALKHAGLAQPTAAVLMSPWAT